jgi:hypothetical protein
MDIEAAYKNVLGKPIYCGHGYTYFYHAHIDNYIVSWQYTYTTVKIALLDREGNLIETKEIQK